MKERIATVGRVALFRDEDGLGVEPIDPRDDLAMTLRVLRWIIGVAFWIGGLISSRRELEDDVLQKVVSRAQAEGRIELK